MRNYNKLFFVALVCMFFTTNCFGGLRDWLHNVFATPYKPAGTAVVEKANELLNDHCPDSATTEKVLTTVAATVGSESVAKAVEYGQKFIPIAWVCAGAYALGKVGETAKDLKSFVYPSNREAAEDLQCAKEFKRLDAEKRLRISAAKHAKEKRGLYSLPVTCENDARKLIMAGGKVELEAIVSDFKTCYGKE